jgi:hypothetical protein
MSKFPNRVVGIFFGVLYILAGVFGFFLTSETGFASATGPKLLDLFQINNLHNLAHVVIGVALLLAGLTGVRPARAANSVLGAVFLVVGIYGLFVANTTGPANFLALNAADNVLNFATAVVLLVVGIGADRAPSPHKLG